MPDVTMAKSDQEKRQVVKFFAAGLKPDVRLKLFRTSEYHVHSVLLKIHSGFFRAFLDSPEKEFPASSKFAYGWVTELDDEGGWHLVAAQSSPQKGRNLPDQCEQHEQECAFNTLMRAIYTKSSMICFPDELVRLVELADYYRALRVVSCTLDQGLLQGIHEGLVYRMMEDPCKYLGLAIKLRNETLFQDCLCLSLGPWTKPKYIESKDRQIQDICDKVRTKIYAQIGEVNEELVNKLNKLARKDPDLRKEMMTCMKKAATKCAQPETDRVSLPAYYRVLWNFKSSDGRHHCHDLISGLMDNQLLLGREDKAGEKDFEDYFLCGFLGIDELPWNIEEEDW